MQVAERQGVQEILNGWSGSSRVFRPALEPGSGPGPTTGHETDGVVLLGSAASVYDDHAWIPSLADWLRPLLRGEPRIPVFGVCFGHQLIAHLADAPIGFVDERRRKVLGVEESHFEGGRLLPGKQVLRVVVSHREEVKRAPAEYRVTAHRTQAPIDGLEHQTLPIFSFQFHPEAREEFVERVGLAPELVDDRLRRDSRRVIEAFLAVVGRG